MPIKRNWYKVEKLLKKRNISGIPEYLVLYEFYKTPYWIPYYDITTDLIYEYEARVREEQKVKRDMRCLRRRIKKEMELPVFEEVPIRGRHPKAKW